MESITPTLTGPIVTTREMRTIETIIEEEICLEKRTNQIS